MGFLDNVVKGLGDDAAGGLSDLLKGQGGVGGLAEKFGQAGLGDVIASWIGSGQNQPISADQLQQVLGSDAIAGMAGKLGLEPADMAGQLSSILPGLVDRLTPGGQQPSGGLGNAGDLMGAFGSLLQR